MIFIWNSPHFFLSMNSIVFLCSLFTIHISRWFSLAIVTRCTAWNRVSTFEFIILIFFICIQMNFDAHLWFCRYERWIFVDFIHFTDTNIRLAAASSNKRWPLNLNVRCFILFYFFRLPHFELLFLFFMFRYFASLFYLIFIRTNRIAIAWQIKTIMIGKYI